MGRLVDPAAVSARQLREAVSSAAGEGAALSVGTVLACVKALYDDATILPVRAYTGDRNGPRAPIRVQPRIVAEPFGPDLDPAAGFGQLVVSIAMRGNAYGYVVSRDKNTNAAGPAVDPAPGRRHAAARQEQGQGLQDRRRGLRPDEIVHMTGLMLPGAVVGIDVLSYQRLTFDLAMKVNAYADGFFGGGGSPAGVISVKGSGDRKKAREVRDAWEATHSGVRTRTGRRSCSATRPGRR
jgi:phage portal protein BeeE